MATTIDLDALKAMTQAELDDLFGRSPADPIPAVGAGTLLFDPGTPLEPVAAEVGYLLL